VGAATVAVAKLAASTNAVKDRFMMILPASALFHFRIAAHASHYLLQTFTSFAGS
jgi:hypothetical protein